MKRALICLIFAVTGCRDLSIEKPPEAGGLRGGLSPNTAVVTVSVIDKDGLRRVATNEADGGFSQVDLTPGLYTLDVQGSRVLQRVVPNVRVLPGQVTDVGVLSLDLRASDSRLVGLVTPPAGGNAAGAIVSFLLQPADQLVEAVTVGADGRFVAQLSPGTYTLTATHPDYVSAMVSGVQLEPDSELDLSMTSPLVLQLNPATLEGTVVAQTAAGGTAPAQSALVTLENGQTTTTDAQGAFRITGLPAGTQTLRVALTNYVDPSPSRLVTLRAGQLTTVPTITLTLLLGSISGDVVLSDGAPVADVEVTASSNADPTLLYAGVVSPDPAMQGRGLFVVNGLPLGAYTLQATRARYSRASAQVTVATAGVTPAGTLRLALQQGDFLIDDADPNNTPGYTRTQRVTLRFTGFPSTGVTDYRVSEDPSFADAGFVAYTGIQQPHDLLDGGDGTRTLYAQYRDTTGATSPSFVNSVYLDTVPPPAPLVTVAHTGTPNGTLRFSKNQVLPLTISGSDPGGLALMRVAGLPADGGVLAAPAVGFQGSATFDRGAAPDGLQTLYVQLVDNAGNASTPGQDAVVVDRVAPTVPTVTITPGPLSTDPNFTNTPFVDLAVMVTAQANGEALYMKVANDNSSELAATAYALKRDTLPWILRNGDGVKTVHVLLQDSAGNVAMTTGSDQVTLDTQPPQPVSASVAGLVRSSPVAVTVASTATDLSPTQAVTVGDVFPLTTTPMMLPPPGNPVSVPLTTIPGTPGVYPANLYVRFRDRAGNDSLITLPFTFDNEPPRGSISVRGALADGTASGTLTASTMVTVSANVQGATGYVLGQAGLTTCPDPVAMPGAYTALPPSGVMPFTLTTMTGTAPIRACFRDAAGNVFGGASSPPLNWDPATSIQVDTSAPTGCTLALVGRLANGMPGPSNRTASADIDARLNGCSPDATESVIVAGNVSCASPGLDWRPIGALTLTLPAGDGVKTVSACARDTARNVQTVSAVNITLDTTPPIGASVNVEFGEGVLNIAEATARGGPRPAFQVTWGDAIELVAHTLDGRNNSGPDSTVTPTTPASGSIASDQLGMNQMGQAVSLGIDPNYDGTPLRIALRFRDDLGNTTPETFTTLNVDLVAPGAPVLQGVAPGNRSATLSWLPPANPFDIVKYEVGTMSPFNKRGEAPAGTQQAAATGLDNRSEYTFAVRSKDDGDNYSVPSMTKDATVGWRRSVLPINSSYPVRPLDVALKGSDIYVTYSERDIDGTVQTGNVRMAVSHDRGATWTLSTVDSVFGWNRSMAQILVNPSSVAVVTVGSDQDAATSTTPLQGEAKLFTSPDGTAWTKYSDANLTNTANWSDVTGAGFINTGGGIGFDIYNLFYFSNPTSTNLLRRINTFSLFSSSLSTFYDHTDSVSVSDLRSCNGNYGKLMMWREGTTLRALTHRFLFDADYVSTEGDVQVAETGVNAFDLDCGSAPGGTDAFAVFLQGSTVDVRGRAGVSSGGWSGTAGTVATDADTRYPPRIHAVGQRAYVVYRPTAGGVRMSLVREAGGTFSISPSRRIEANPSEGAWSVVGGDAVDDVVVAYADVDGTSISVLVPELQGVTAQVAPGIGVSTLRWSVSGFNNYLVTQAPGYIDTLGLLSPYTYNYVPVPSFDVAFPPGPPDYFQPGIADAFGQNSNDGEVWQVSPFLQTTVFTPLSTPAASSNTAGLVANEQDVLVMPHAGVKASADSDLTLYRSTDQGATWAAFQPPAAVTTSVRALVGAQGRAVLAYRNAGLKARLFTSYGTGATYPGESVIDTTTNADLIAAETDGAGRVAIATANLATDEITVAWSSDNGATFAVRPRILIPTPASYAITALSVWRVDATRMVVAWRQSGGTSQRVYFAESTTLGTSFSAPVLVFDGTTGTTGNQYVANTTLVQGSGNGAYSVVGTVSQDASTPPSQNNLWLSVTGTDHPAVQSFSQFVLDQQPANKTSFDLVSNGDGHQVVYVTSNLGTSVTDTYLKLASCLTNCHLLANWYRTTLATYGPGITLAPKLAVSTSASGAPRSYVLFLEGGRLRVLRGGIARRLQ